MVKTFFTLILVGSWVKIRIAKLVVKRWKFLARFSLQHLPSKYTANSSLLGKIALHEKENRNKKKNEQSSVWVWNEKGVSECVCSWRESWHKNVDPSPCAMSRKGKKKDCTRGGKVSICSRCFFNHNWEIILRWWCWLYSFASLVTQVMLRLILSSREGSRLYWHCCLRLY